MGVTTSFKKLGRANILVEGIDGSGKDEFVARLVRLLKSRFEYAPDATLSIVGQPAFQFDKDGLLRALMERGEVLASLDNTIEILVENRRCHEEYLKRYSGLVFCLRGILTEIGTLMRLFNASSSSIGSLGQERAIDLLVIVDADPDVAYRRILGRPRPPDWRETPENLVFFRQFYLDKTDIPCVRQRLVFENAGTLEDMDMFVAKVADLIEKIWS